MLLERAQCKLCQHSVFFFPFYLQIHYIISFLFITVLSFQNVSKLPAFHLWDACFPSPSFPHLNNQKNPKL